MGSLGLRSEGNNGSDIRARKARPSKGGDVQKGDHGQGVRD